MNHKTKSKVLDDVAQQYHRKDIDLSSRILSKVQKDKVNIMKTKIAITAVLSAVFVLAVLFAIPTTATAMKRILSFIPGIGVVDNEVPMRVLKESAKVEQNGTTVSVIQGVIDSKNTILAYQVENLPNFSVPIDSQFVDVCHQLPELKLPDGSILSGQSEAGENWLSGYSRRIVFPTLPVEINSAQLVFSCFEQSMMRSDSPKLEITMDFIQAAGEEVAYQIVDLPTPEPQPSTSSIGEGSYASDIQLAVDRYVETDKNLILFGNLKSLSGNTRVEGFDKNAIHLVDSNGVEIPLSEDSTVIYPSDLTPGSNSHPWAYLIESTYAAGQATLTVDSILIRVNDIARFKVDLGESPQPGQKMLIGQPVDIAGREVQIQSAEVNAEGNGLSFTVTKPEEVSGLILMDFDHPLLGGGGYETYGFTYRDGLPSGEINVTIVSALVQITGPWEAKIDLPASTLTFEPVDYTTACLTQSSWQKALDESPALPDNLGGTLGISGFGAPDFIYRAMTTSLDGTNPKTYSKGRDITLSPDGLRAVYNDDSTGLKLLDLGTQTVTALVDTGLNDRGPIWSPDSSKIAFTRGPKSGLIGGKGPFSIIIANPDGTQQVPVVDDGEANTVYAWNPDGQSLIYTVAGPNGASVRSIDISSGEVTPLFETDFVNTTLAISPDGKRIAYQDMLPGDNWAIYIADMDDPSNPRLVVNGSPVVVTRPFWSPDGEWLIASVFDESISDEKGFVTLINVDTCQIIPLMNLSGYVTSWNQ